jgi:Putative metallopeptidase
MKSLMRGSMSHALAAALVGLASNLAAPAVAQDSVSAGAINDNDSIFIDGQTFRILPGKAKGDAAAQIRELDARDLGPGAIVFRSGDRLYIVDTPLRLTNRGPGAPNAYVDAGREQPNRIHIEYTLPKNPQHQALYEMIRARHVLEDVQQIFSPFRLPTQVTIKTMGCDGLVNAWFNTDNSVPTVHICYELLQMFLDTGPKETTPQGITPQDALVGQFFLWVSHEFGHAIFDMYEVPVLGREEDAADQFAGYIMLQFGKDRAHRLFEGAAYGVKDLIRGYKQNPQLEYKLTKLSSVHGLPEQRFYNLICMAYGADPATFADVVDDEYLPKRRADNCEYEFQNFRRAWNIEIGPHIDRQMAQAVLDTTWLPRLALSPPEK